MTFTKIQTLAAATGYHVEHRPTVRVRGWPQKSEKPYALFSADWKHICSFKTIDALERNLRARAGC